MSASGGGALRAALEDILASTLPVGERRWLCRVAATAAVLRGSAMVHGTEREELSLGIVDAACCLAARAFGKEGATLGELARWLKAAGPPGQALARRLSKASKARRLRAHPDPLLLGDLEALLLGSSGIGGLHLGEVSIGDVESAMESTDAEECKQSDQLGDYDVSPGAKCEAHEVEVQDEFFNIVTVDVAVQTHPVMDGDDAAGPELDDDHVSRMVMEVWPVDVTELLVRVSWLEERLSFFDAKLDGMYNTEVGNVLAVGDVVVQANEARVMEPLDAAARKLETRLLVRYELIEQMMTLSEANLQSFRAELGDEAAGGALLVLDVHTWCWRSRGWLDWQLE